MARPPKNAAAPDDLPVLTERPEDELPVLTETLEEETAAAAAAPVKKPAPKAAAKAPERPAARPAEKPAERSSEKPAAQAAPQPAKARPAAKAEADEIEPTARYVPVQNAAPAAPAAPASEGPDTEAFTLEQWTQLADALTPKIDKLLRDKFTEQLAAVWVQTWSEIRAELPELVRAELFKYAARQKK